MYRLRFVVTVPFGVYLVGWLLVFCTLAPLALIYGLAHLLRLHEEVGNYRPHLAGAAFVASIFADRYIDGPESPYRGAIILWAVALIVLWRASNAGRHARGQSRS